MARVKLSKERRDFLRANPRKAETFSELRVVLNQRLASIGEAEKLLGQVTADAVRKHQSYLNFRSKPKKDGSLYLAKKPGPVVRLTNVFMHACSLDEADPVALGSNVEYIVAAVKKNKRVKDLVIHLQGSSYLCEIISEGDEVFEGTHFLAPLAVMGAFLNFARSFQAAKLVEVQRGEDQERKRGKHTAGPVDLGSEDEEPEELNPFG